MMLPEMTSSARVARTFLRFARGAVAGLALAVLAACGGGGGSSTPATPTPTPAPEMTITPPAPTAEDIASATDITGQDSFEVRLDSANPRAFYKIRVDEPTVLALRGEDGLEVTVYDSAGTVVNPLSPEPEERAPGGEERAPGGGVSQSENMRRSALASAAPGFSLSAAGTFVITVAPAAPLAGSATETALIHVGTVGGAGIRLKSPRALDRENVEVKISSTESTEVSIEESFEIDNGVTSIGWLPFSVETPFGKFSLTGDKKDIDDDWESVVRISRRDTEGCPTGTERTKEETIRLRLSWAQFVVIGGKIHGYLRSGEFEGTWTLNAASAPRRKGDSPQPIAVRLQEEGSASRPPHSATVVLTDFIEDPEGETLTFEAWDWPGSLSSRGVQDPDDVGPSLSIEASVRPDGQLLFSGGEFKVTATDPDDECWTFPVRVSVGEEEEEPGGGEEEEEESPRQPEPGNMGGAPSGTCSSGTCNCGLVAIVFGDFTCLEAPSGHGRLRSCAVSGAGGCPRTHAGNTQITSCLLPDGAREFSYVNLDGPLPATISLAQEVCEDLGGRLTIH